jgi:hypothetical protein
MLIFSVSTGGTTVSLAPQARTFPVLSTNSSFNGWAGAVFSQ